MYLKAKPENPHFTSSLCRPVHCAIPRLQTQTWASFTFGKDLRSEPDAALCVHLIKQSTSAPSSCYSVGRGGEAQRGGGRWRQLIESLGCGSLALVLGGRPRFCCRRRRSQPQTEEDDEVTDVEGSRAAVRWGVSVPRQLDQTQDQNPEWNKIQICVLLKCQDRLNSAKYFNKNFTMYFSSMSGLQGFTSLCLTWLSHS